MFLCVCTCIAPVCLTIHACHSKPETRKLSEWYPKLPSSTSPTLVTAINDTPFIITPLASLTIEYLTGSSLLYTSLITRMGINSYDHDDIAPGQNKACLMTGVDELSMTTRAVPAECGPWE